MIGRAGAEPFLFLHSYHTKLVCIHIIRKQTQLRENYGINVNEFLLNKFHTFEIDACDAPPSQNSRARAGRPDFDC